MFTSNGQLLIGSAVAPNIRIGTLTSSDSSITWTVGNGTISGVVAGGTSSLKTITGNTGAVSPTAGNINLIGADGIFITANAGTSTQTITPFEPGTANTFMGKASGNATSPGSYNVAFGGATMSFLNGGYQNNAFGYDALGNVTIGHDNTGNGYSTLNNLTTGNENTAIGSQLGGNYTTSESNNILLGYNIPGVTGESNITRIGNGQTECFIQGIAGNTISANLANVTINTSTGQLGVSNTQIPIITYTNVNHAMSPYTVLATDDYISCDTSGGTVQLLFPNTTTASRIFVVKDRLGTASTSNISITTVGGTVTIDGQTTYKITSNYGSVNLLFNSATYEVY